MRKGFMVLVIAMTVFVAGQVQAQDTTCTGTVFNDVNSATQPLFCGWIEWFSDLGITAGCSSDPPLYCPNSFVTRAQMAVFVSKAMRGGHDNSVTYHSSTVGGGEGNTASGAWSTVGGGQGNAASSERSTVGGGWNNTASGAWSTVGGGEGNTASANWTTVGGGEGNAASAGVSTVAGGQSNVASGVYSTVGGGWGNAASGYMSTVVGGRGNRAGGEYSFAAGRRAKANVNGCFVWGDSTDADVNCNVPNRWQIRASGGVFFFTNSAMNSGVRVSGGSSTWETISDRDSKENFAEVDGKEILNRLSQIPIRTWNWKTQEPSIRHMGPVSQDFYDVFNVGEDDKHISTVDADGVALAAIQGLYQVVMEKDAVIAEQDARIRQLESALAEVLKRISALEMPSKNIAQK